MAGGWPMIPLLILSVLALAIIIERFWSLRRRAVLPPGLGEEVRAWAVRQQLDPAHIEILRRNSPLGELLAAGLDMRQRPREVIRERIEDVGRHVVHRLERFLNTLGTIAQAGPLLGLLGTVLGMIDMFLGILDHGVGDVNQVAGGIGKALICAAAGMCVAIPALMFQRYFHGRVDGYVVEMERQAISLVDTLDPAPQVLTPSIASPERQPAKAGAPAARARAGAAAVPGPAR
nr:MotA/TolQ/ExbB proton channel family protein [Coralloluteibacterium stylophorae]